MANNLSYDAGGSVGDTFGSLLGERLGQRLPRLGSLKILDLNQHPRQVAGDRSRARRCINPYVADRRLTTP